MTDVKTLSENSLKVYESPSVPSFNNNVENNDAHPTFWIEQQENIVSIDNCFSYIIQSLK